MRIRTGHRPEDWTTSVPAEPLPSRGFGGALITGAPGPVEKARIHANAVRKEARAEKAKAVEA